METLWIILGALVCLLIGVGIASSGGDRHRRRPVTETVAFTGANYSGLAGIHIPDRLLKSSGGMFLEDEDGNRVTMLPTVTLQDKDFYQAYEKLVESRQPGSLGSTVCHRGSVGTPVVTKPRSEKSGHRDRVHDELIDRLERMVTEKMAAKPPSSPVTVEVHCTSDSGMPAATATAKEPTARAESPAPAPKPNEEFIPADKSPTG